MNKSPISDSYNIFVFKNYSPAERVTYLITKLKKTKYFLGSTRNANKNGLNEQKTYKKVTSEWVRKDEKMQEEREVKSIMRRTDFSLVILLKVQNTTNEVMLAFSKTTYRPILPTSRFYGKNLKLPLLEE